ncbi:Pex12 amino terminal region-domain-containing protein [Clohesyomyces aquaticus]|uniref:Pex12 amino terminal region-domain-containing protein n=1 Tax=Clohesyomyces aquaticus TaxID=1231657 RepID=A0A1Y1Z806_9PLEO|nr:Pex12 amino terminal region-domain-containing protein [Clohesyomyces aquaticus]
MPSADFAAAQERLAARRAQRASQHQRLHHDPSSRSRTSRTVSLLPFPFSTVGSAGLGAWHAIKGREGTRPEFRVGQVDAELLDEELLALLKSQVGEGLKYFGSHLTDTWSAEILLALRLILFKLSIWNNNASYGAHLQGLRYADARSKSSARPPPKPWQKVAYGIITIGGRYSWTKWEEYLLAAQEDYTVPQSDALQFASRMTEYINNAHDIAGLASFLIFLINGRYRTITDRVLRLRLTPTTHAAQREVSFEYLNRQLVWHAFTEFLLFLLPLVGISRWRRILGRSWRKFKVSVLTLLGRKSSTTSASDNEEDRRAAGELGFLPQRTCAICYRDQNPTTASEADVLSASAGGGGVVGSAATDITNPYEAMPCGCVYCFACLAQRIANEEGEGWTCLRCGELVKECRPWSGDILDEKKSSGGDDPHAHAHHAGGKTVGFVAADEEKSESGLALREVDPIPVPEQDDAPGVSLSAQAGMGMEATRGLDLGDSLGLGESQAWAHASEAHSSSDEQSEEYDEDEEEEGEELEEDYE